MKKELKEALKPQKPFEDWAEENGVEINGYTPITKKQWFSGWIRQKKVIAGLSAVLAVCLVFAILLPVLLLSNNDVINPPKTYTSQESISNSIEELEELYQIENLLLFNKNKIIEFDTINIEVANDDENLVLSYIIKNCLLAANDGINAFYIDYRIRLYEYYEFFGYLNYSDLTQNFSIGNTKIYFKIQDRSNEKQANVKFVYNNLEYFLEVKGFPEATDITEDTLKILLNDLLA